MRGSGQLPPHKTMTRSHFIAMKYTAPPTPLPQCFFSLPSEDVQVAVSMGAISCFLFLLTKGQGLSLMEKVTNYSWALAIYSTKSQGSAKPRPPTLSSPLCPGDKALEGVIKEMRSVAARTLPTVCSPSHITEQAAFSGHLLSPCARASLCLKCLSNLRLRRKSPFSPRSVSALVKMLITGHCDLPMNSLHFPFSFPPKDTKSEIVERISSCPMYSASGGYADRDPGVGGLNGRVSLQSRTSANVQRP